MRGIFKKAFSALKMTVIRSAQDSRQEVWQRYKNRERSHKEEKLACNINISLFRGSRRAGLIYSIAAAVHHEPLFSTKQFFRSKRDLEPQRGRTEASAYSFLRAANSDGASGSHELCEIVSGCIVSLLGQLPRATALACFW